MHRLMKLPQNVAADKKYFFLPTPECNEYTYHDVLYVCVCVYLVYGEKTN